MPTPFVEYKNPKIRPVQYIGLKFNWKKNLKAKKAQNSFHLEDDKNGHTEVLTNHKNVAVEEREECVI